MTIKQHLLEQIFELQKAYCNYSNFHNYSKNWLEESLENWFDTKILSPKFDKDFMLKKNINKIKGLDLSDMFLDELARIENQGRGGGSGASLYLSCNFKFDENMRVVEDNANYGGRSLKGANFNKALKVALQARFDQKAYPFYKYVGNGEYALDENYTIESVFNNLTTELSKVKQRMMAKGQIVLSANPIDYLTMSENKHNWSSCHSLDGCHAAGTLAYLQDANSYVAYLASEEKVKLFENNDEAFYWNSKQWRAMIYVKQGIGFTVQFHYPFKSPVIEQEVVELVKEAFFDGIELQQLDGVHERLIINRQGPAYVDNHSICYMINGDLTQSERTVNIGDAVYCPDCGARQEDGDTESDSFVCLNCSGYSCCDHCGEQTYEEHLYWIESDDQIVCEYCRDEYYFYCEQCNEYHKNNTATEVHVMYGNRIEAQNVCEGCLSSGSYTSCSDCDDIFDFDDVPMYVNKDGDCFCPDCAEHNKDEEEEE